MPTAGQIKDAFYQLFGDPDLAALGAIDRQVALLSLQADQIMPTTSNIRDAFYQLFENPDLAALGAIDRQVALLYLIASNPPSGGGGTSRRYSDTFTDSNLTVAGLLVRSHDFGVFPTSVRVVSSAGEEVYPTVVDQSTSAIAVDLSAFRPLGGTWRILVGG